MVFSFKKHDNHLYITLLTLSRDIFFYKNLELKDDFETRLYLMFIHFSIILKVFKKKGSKFNQNLYDSLFHNIENSIREMGYGDVAVNKKMKDFNKLLYDILLKLENENKNSFLLNDDLVFKYFPDFMGSKKDNYDKFKDYLTKFYYFCFELPLDNMVREVIKFKY
tara:strand:- start:427 stop:924 length:498 start_codon:yes stop_codon:yes gene_type:complete